MKNRFIITLLSCLILFSYVSSVSADTPYADNASELISVFNPKTGNHEIIVAASVVALPDGSKIIISDPLQSSCKGESGKISANKPYSFVNSNNVLQWRIILTASFSYDGTNSACLSADSETTIYQGNWSESSNNTYPSGNSAIAQVTVVRKVLFIVVETQNAFFTITCDANGHVS